MVMPSWWYRLTRSVSMGQRLRKESHSAGLCNPLPGKSLPGKNLSRGETMRGFGYSLLYNCSGLCIFAL